MNAEQIKLINTFISDLKQSAFYPDLWHSATPALLQVAGSYLYDYETPDSDFDITVWIEPKNLSWDYGHCWHEVLQYEGKRVEWYYVPVNIEEIIDKDLPLDNYNFTLSSLAFIGMAWNIKPELIIEVKTQAGQNLLNSLKTTELKQKLLAFSAKHLYLKLFDNKPLDWVEHFYADISPKHLYRIMLVFYNYLNLPINTGLIWALKEEKDFLSYIPEIYNICIEINKRLFTV